MTVLVPNAPVTSEDVCDAARVILGLDQRETYIAWRETRWYDDKELRVEVEQQRWSATVGRRNRFLLRAHEGDVFSVPVAQDVLLAGVAMTPMAVISSLNQLGVRHDTSSDDDFGYAFALLDRPDLFDPARGAGVALSEVRVVDQVLGTDRFRLMWQAGWSGDAIVDAAYTNSLPDLSALRTMAALRSPLDGRSQ